MEIFEFLVLLLFAAAVLLAGSSRIGVPYPTLLSLLGVAVALTPIAPTIGIDPKLALAVFIAPALLDAAFDTSPRELKRLWLPLLALAVGAVVTTAAVVALIGWYWIGLPLAAALALGAIVAPPDAAASTAILNQVRFSRRSTLVLQGESLLNDATALLLFGAATASVAGWHEEHEAWSLALAAPGGIAIGLGLSWFYQRLTPLFSGTHSATIVEFTATFGVWIIAEHLHMSAVLAVVAFAMLAAHHAPARQTARDRVQSYAVWAAAVFVLNVIAFLLMGTQARAILAALSPAELPRAIGFALVVLAAVILVRLTCVLGYRAFSGWLWQRFRPAWLTEPPPWRLSVLVSWCGMRGLLTLATSFALPQNFPGRDYIVLAAFTVVLGTLVLQGLTLRPLMRLFDAEAPASELADDLGEARRTLLAAGLDAAKREPEKVAQLLRTKLDAARDVSHSDDPQGATAFDRGLANVVDAQRKCLNAMRHRDEIAEDVFDRLQEELDWLELAARPNREIEVREA